MKLLVLQNRQGKINNKIIFAIYFIQNQYFIGTLFKPDEIIDTPF